MSTEEVTATPFGIPGSLAQLAEVLDSKSHLLASTGDEELAAAALQATKDIFELGISNEARSHPHLHPFLISILEPPSVGTRSKSKGKKAKSPSPAPEAVDPGSVLPYTPLSELTTAGLEVEQIWAQLELRAEGVVQVVKEVGPGDSPVDLDESDAGLSDEEDQEDGSDEEMTIEEWKKMMADNGIDEDADSDEEDGSDEDGDSDESEVDSDDEDNMISWKDEDGMSMSGDEDEEDEEEDEEGESEEDDEEDDDEEEDDEEEETDEEDLAEFGADIDMDEDAETGDGDNAPDDRVALKRGAKASRGDDEPGPSRRVKKGPHPTLDDGFFSIDDFNRQTEEAEAGKLSTGRLGGDDGEDDEDDLGDAGALMLQDAPQEDDDIMFADFFDIPRDIKRAEMFKDKGKGKGKGKERGREPREDKKGKGKGKGVQFDDDVEVEEASDDEEEGRDVMGRVTDDLFDSDDEEEGVKTLSTHERQQLELAKQIAELEGQAIGPKDWTLMGEATSRARPENSLLEEDLDFEQVAKVVPVITEERVASIEEIIRKRIIDNNFDSTVRVRAYEPTPYLPSRYLDLQDTQSSKSLAQIYEEEFQAAAAGGKAVDPRDAKLKKEHEEVDKLWGDICYKLDALSSLNFVPKAPKAQITTVENVATATMESALPPTSAPTTLLAPEEMFAPPTAKALVARSELTPEEAQAARGKRKREKKAERQKLGNMAELYGKRRGGVKAEKERALQGLVKTGKGVTVLGKGEKERGKAAKRAGEEAKNDGKRLKL